MGGSGVIAAILFCNDKVNVRSSVKNKDVRVSDIEQLINAWLPRGVANRITQETFQMGGAGCAVQLKEGEQWGSTVRCLEGLVQAGGIEPIFMKQLPSSFSYEGKALVVAVDGVVESVGQIHTILEKSASQDLIILARSFLPDVANTIAVNYQQKKTRCIPFVVGDWALNNFLEFHNLGVACVSTESGDVISNVQLGGEIVASVSHNEIILENNVSRKRRISVELGRDLGAMRGLALDRIKTMLALVRFTIRTGFSTVTYDERTFYVPKSSYLAAIKTKESVEKSLRELGAVIIEKKEQRGKNAIFKKA